MTLLSNVNEYLAFLNDDGVLVESKSPFCGNQDFGAAPVETGLERKL